MASGFRDFSRGVGGRRGTATLGGLSTSTAETDSLDIQIDARGIFDFFEQRDQDKADKAFNKKNADILGLTPEDIDDLSRKDLRRLKGAILDERLKARTGGVARQNFLDFFNQVPQAPEGMETSQVLEEAPNPLGDLFPTHPQKTGNADFIEEDIDLTARQKVGQSIATLFNRESDPTDLEGLVFNEKKGFLESLTIPSSTVEPRSSIDTPSVQPENFGEFVDEVSDPTLRPMQQIQDALIQLSPGDAFRIQNDPVFRGIIALAQRTPQVGQLVQDAKGALWSVTFNFDGSVKEEKKLGITKRVPSEKNTIKVMQIQREDGSLGMDAVSIDKDSKIIGQTPIPGAVPNTLRLDVGGLSKGTRSKVEGRLIELSKNLKELNKLDFALFGPGAGGQGVVGKELLTGLGRLKAGILEFADRFGTFDPDLPLGKVITRAEKFLGGKLSKELKADLQQFRRIENLAGRMLVAFQKEMTGVAGPPETFERLAAISVDIRKLGPVGMREAIGLLQELNQDEQDLLKNSFLASNKEEFIEAMSDRIDTRLDAFKLRIRNNPQLSGAVENAEARAIQNFAIRQRVEGTSTDELSSGLLGLIDNLK